MPFIDRNPLAYPANSYDPIVRFRTQRAPTAADFRNFSVGNEWLDDSSNDWWKLCYKDQTLGIWRKMCGTAAASEEFLPDAGTSPVIPNAANQITIVGGNGIITTGGLNQWDTSMQSPFVGDFIFENNTPATLVYVSIENNDATDPGSYSALVLTSQALAGDAFVLFDVAPAAMYMSLGIDNSDGDRFKLVNNTTPSGGNEIFMVDTALTSFWHYSGQLYQSNDWAGGTVFTRIQNTDNTNTGSNACLEILPGGAGGGDPYVQWQVGAVAQQYSLGIDNSVAGDPLKLTDGDSPSLGNEYMLLDIPASRWEFPINIFLQEIANIGGAVSNFVSNTDNTDAASDAAFQALTGGLNGGDPFLHVEVDSVQEYSFGIDNSDTDILKLTDGASPSAGNVLFQITAAGAPSFPTAPLDVPSGGTGVNTITDGALIVGSGVGAVTDLGVMVDGDLVIGSTGVDPVITQLTAGAGIAIASGAGTITIAATGSGLAYVEVTAATQAMAVETCYGTNRGAGVTCTLPAAAAVGSVMEIVGILGLAAINQNAGQQIHFGAVSTTAGAGGSATMTNAHDCVTLRCVVVNAEWVVQAMVGNWVIV